MHQSGIIKEHSDIIVHDSHIPPLTPRSLGRATFSIQS